MLGIIKRNFKYLTINSVVLLYKSMVRSHLGLECRIAAGGGRVSRFRVSVRVIGLLGSVVGLGLGLWLRLGFVLWLGLALEQAVSGTGWYSTCVPSLGLLQFCVGVWYKMRNRVTA